jgi:uncharacterized protein (DUF1501 family)
MATLEQGIQAVRCADCARSDSAVRDVSPTQHLAIPTDALAGHADRIASDHGRLSRRALLRNGVAGVAAVYASTRLPWSAIWDAARADAAGNPNASKLVLIYLQGGADGLNMFVPTGQYSAYQSQRANIARIIGASNGTGQPGATDLGNAGGVAFANPLLSGATNNQLYPGVGAAALGLDSLWSQNKLAVFPAADYNPPNLSHFDSRDFWFAGALEQLPTGWLGRWLDAEGSQTNPLQAVSLDSSLSKQIRTSVAPVCALDGLSGIQFGVNGVNQADPNQYVGPLSQVPPTPGNSALYRSRGQYGLTIEVGKEVNTIAANSSAAPYPTSYLADRLRLAAQLLGAGLGVRVVTVDWGSFDTHGDEVGSMDPQLAVLGASLAAFQADLQARGVADDTITMVFSEFGRRVQSNDSGGTDHGAGGAMMLLGNKIRGGLASPPPDVVNLDNDGDLVVETDFRWVYKAIFAEHLGTDPTRYLPDLPAGQINRYDGSHTIF